MIKQRDLGAGCIPACALEVMSRLDPNATLPTEAALIASMRTVQGSGFVQLHRAVASLAPAFKVDVFEANPPIADLEASANGGELPLVCIDNAKLGGGRAGPVAHCLVVEGYDSKTTEWNTLDPWPAHADENPVPHLRFAVIWCGGYAVIRKK